MKRIQYQQYGGTDVLRLEEFNLPALGPEQVRIRVRAASANPMDWKIRKGDLKMMSGNHFPRGYGHDFAGVVEAIGANTTRLNVGDEVFGATGFKEAGAYAQYLNAEEKNVFLKPHALRFEEAAALPVVSATAWTALINKANLQAGQRVFITGCLGGVGRIAIQIARMLDAEVVGSCNNQRRAEALAAGVQEVIDYQNFDARKLRNQFDVVFDTHGSLSLSECNVLLKSRGVSLHIVPTPAKIVRGLFSPRHQVIFAQLTLENMSEIAAKVDQGVIKPMIGKVVPLTDAIPALIELETQNTPKGKLVLDCTR